MVQAGFSTLNYVILFIYLGAMVTIGVLVAGKQKTTEDYFLASRKMPWFVVAMSMLASLTSAISYMGLPGTAYKENIALVAVAPAGLIVIPLLTVTLFPIYRRLNITTSYEYIFHRYGPAARYAVSGLFMAARLGWLATVMYAPALALSVVTGINVYFAIILMGVLAVSYTVMGGLAAVLWTDVAQFVILVGGAIWIAISLLVGVDGGLPEIMNIAGRTDHLNVFDWRVSLFEMTALAVLISYLVQYMHDTGTDQVSIQRLMSTPNLRGMAKAAVTSVFFDMSVGWLLLFLGIGLFAWYQQHPGTLPLEMAQVNQDRILPYYIIHHLPNGVSGLLIAGIFAAAMSSMDSGINSLSTVLVNDFIKPLRTTQRTEAQDVRLARILTLAVGAFAMGLAFYVSTIQQILAASSQFLGLFGGPIVALFLLGMLSRRAHFGSWLVGTIPAVLITYFGVIRHTWMVGGEMVKVHFIYYFPICFGITLVIGYIASLLIPAPLADEKYTIFYKPGQSAQ